MWCVVTSLRNHCSCCCVAESLKSLLTSSFWFFVFYKLWEAHYSVRQDTSQQKKSSTNQFVSLILRGWNVLWATDSFELLQLLTISHRTAGRDLHTGSSEISIIQSEKARDSALTVLLFLQQGTEGPAWLRTPDSGVARQAHRPFVQRNILLTKSLGHRINQSIVTGLSDATLCFCQLLLYDCVKW